MTWLSKAEGGARPHGCKGQASRELQNGSGLSEGQTLASWVLTRVGPVFRGDLTASLPEVGPVCGSVSNQMGF